MHSNPHIIRLCITNILIEIFSKSQGRKDLFAFHPVEFDDLYGGSPAWKGLF